jgi:pyrroloquinoline quinone (PQQ) biosynthesis protein C
MTPFQQLQHETEAARGGLLAAPVLEDLAAGRFGLANYVQFLGNAYHHVRHTVPLMMACGARLPDRLQWLRGPLKEYIDEEFGHEEWILDDLEACGVSRARVQASEPDFEVDVLVSYVYDYVERRSPVGFLGMVHVLEGTSTALATEAARLVQTQLGLPDAAFSYLRSHGALDIEHVGFFERLVDRLAPEDLEHVVRVAQRVYRLYGDVLQSAAPEGVRRAA